MITLANLAYICQTTPNAILDKYVDPLNAAIEEFSISNVPEFLAQVAHESGGFNYDREIWGPTQAQRGYEGRKDLGNTQPGDGKRFRGRGLIQITGRANYAECGEALDLPLTDTPELLEEPTNAARSAAWFWKEHNLDSVTDFEKLTRRINGGLNGYEDRLANYQRAKKCFA